MSAARYASNDGSFTLKITFWERDESGQKCSHICLLMLNMYCGLRTLDTKNTSLYHYSTPGLSKTESTQSVFTNKLEI